MVEVCSAAIVSGRNGSWPASGVQTPSKPSASVARAAAAMSAMVGFRLALAGVLRGIRVQEPGFDLECMGGASVADVLAGEDVAEGHRGTHGAAGAGVGAAHRRRGAVADREEAVDDRAVVAEHARARVGLEAALGAEIAGVDDEP
jgi:hypothetical protein